MGINSTKICPNIQKTLTYAYAETILSKPSVESYTNLSHTSFNLSNVVRAFASCLGLPKILVNMAIT